MFKNYKMLYEQSKKNLELLSKRNSDLYNRYIQHQKKSLEYEKSLREKIAKLTIDLDDANGFLEQEKRKTFALLQELRKTRKKRSAKSGGDNDGK